jgi:hypothetical protein
MPRNCCSRASPIPAFLVISRENGYYGDGDSTPHVARRVESLRNPSGRRSRTARPTARVPRRAAARGGGGTVT